MKRLAVVDFLRGFSIFTIVLMHLVQSYPLPGFLDKAASLGGAGVHVFILCSGFGLYLSSLYKPLRYGQFLKRRFSKVYIPYVIVVAVSTLYFGLVCSQDVLMPFLSSVFLFKMFVPSLENAFGGQMWFVSTIIQFYLAWPLIVRLFKINGGGILRWLSVCYGLRSQPLPTWATSGYGTASSCSISGSSCWVCGSLRRTTSIRRK